MFVRPQFFVFCEKRTGAARFKIEADGDCRLPVDQAASVLAMHCLVHGQAPEDFMVTIAPGEDLLRGVTSRAERLLEAGKAIAPPVRISRREQEVLNGVLQDLANKEIAARLHLSERTVKFHVSSLLAKFGVRGRVGLMRVAGNLVSPRGLGWGVAPVAFPVAKQETPFSRPPSLAVRQQAGGAEHIVRLPRRLLTA